MAAPAQPARVRVALDWTPNANHIGLALAIQRGFFAEANPPLEVSLISPHADGYKTTPAARLADGGAELACVPSESVVSWATWPGGDKPKIRAVATLLQGSAHAIVTLKSSGISRPALLDGKKYASYGARYEGRIVQEMIRRDGARWREEAAAAAAASGGGAGAAPAVEGGTGVYSEVTPPMLDIWDAFLKGEADATWIFLPWEGVMARRAGIELNAFNPDDYVDYGHSPVMAAHPDFIRDKPDVLRAFLSAARRGYAEAAMFPEAAAEALRADVAERVASGEWPQLPAPLEEGLMRDAARAVAPYLVGRHGWGHMDMERWSKFVAFLDSAGLLTDKVQSRQPGGASLDDLRTPGGAGARVAPPAAGELATNEFLPPPL